MSITFRVPGMTCGGCAGRIAKAIRAEDPAATVAFDLGERWVRIESAAIDAAGLQDAIQAAGYSATEEQPRAAEPSRQHGCGCAARRAANLDMPQTAAPAAGGCCG